MTIQKRTHTIVRQRSPSKRHEALFVSTPALDADLCGFRSCPISGRVLRCRADALGRNAAFRSKSAYAAYRAGRGPGSVYQRLCLACAGWLYKRRPRAAERLRLWGRVWKTQNRCKWTREPHLRLVFSDSHYDPQPIAGYARQWFTQPIASSVSLGAGYTVALSTRSDGWYIPFPIILPLATVRFSRFSLMTTGLP